MVHNHRLHAWFAPALFVLIFMMLGGCAVKKGIQADPTTGVNLTYQMLEDRTLQYQHSIETTQKSEVRGRAIEAKIKNAHKFSVQSRGLKGKNFLLKITLDALSMQVESAGGTVTPDMGSLIGKTFDIVLSPLGREIEYIGTESLQYELGQGGKRNIDSFFKSIFPDLADRTVKIGDSWTSRDDTLYEGGGIETHIISDTVHTLQGVETINGLDCIKVTAAITGTIEGKGKQGGADLTFLGKSTGTTTWYFAYKQGIFVKDNVEMGSESTITISAQNLTIPATTKVKVETDLIKWQ